VAKKLLSFLALSTFMLSIRMDSARSAALPIKPSFEQELNVSRPFPERSEADSNFYAIGEPNGVLILRQALALTLINNPELKAFSLETRAAEARELQAGLWPNPEIDIEAENVGGTGELSGFDGAETTIQLSQLIELGGKSQKRRKVASLEKELAGAGYQAKRLEILTEAGKAFIELLAVQERTTLLSELSDVSRQALNSVTQRVEAGKDPPLEKTKASVAFSNVRIEHKQAMKELVKAKKNLASFWDNEQPVFTQAQGQLDVVSDIPEIDVLRQKLVSNPQLTRWDTEISRNRAAVELAKSQSVPDITIGGGLRRFSETDDNALVFGVSIPLPISDRNQGGRREAAYNLAKSYEEQRAARIEVTNQFNQIYTELSSSLDKIRELKASVLPGAQEVFEASQEAYAQGKIDYLNVLDAQRTYFVSQSDYLEALLTYHKAKTDMDGLVGQNINKESVQQ